MADKEKRAMVSLSQKEAFEIMLGLVKLGIKLPPPKEQKEYVPSEQDRLMATSCDIICAQPTCSDKTKETYRAIKAKVDAYDASVKSGATNATPTLDGTQLKSMILDYLISQKIIQSGATK